MARKTYREIIAEYIIHKYEFYEAQVNALQRQVRIRNFDDILLEELRITTSQFIAFKEFSSHIMQIVKIAPDDPDELYYIYREHLEKIIEEKERLSNDTK